MRPLELTLEGFKSYRSPQTFNFESRTLFGIVGPTGSGKSSILEGLIFGLYGKTPSAESGTKKLINSQEDQARVQLVFETDDVAWEVIRIIRQKGTSQTILRRIDGVGDPATGDRNVTERIEEIVGLDFESFRSSVVLAQGEFDRFLKATPTERSRILKGIFRLERVDLLREGARVRLQVVEGQISVLKSGLAGFTEDPATVLKKLRGEVLEAQQFAAEVKQQLPKVLKAEQEALRSADEIERVNRDISQTEAALVRLPPEETLRDLADLREKAERRLKAVQDEFEAATRALDRAGRAEAAASQASGGDGWFTAVEAGLSARKRLVTSLEAAHKESAEAERLQRSAAAGLPGAEEAMRSAEEQLAGLRAELAGLQQSHAAHLLRLDLTPGEPCPVCEHPVAGVPHSEPLPTVGAAEQAVAGAEARLKIARSELDSAATRLALAGERLRHTVTRCEGVEAEMQEVEGRLAELAGGVKDLAAEVSSRREALTAARAALDAARKNRDLADSEERGARRALDELARRSGEVTNLLSNTSGLLGISAVAPEGEGLWDAAKRVMEAGALRLESLLGQQRALSAAAQEAVLVVGSFRQRFGASADDQASDVLARANAQLVRLESRVEETEAAIVKKTELEGQIEALEARRKNFVRLIGDFADSKFTAFLLDEQRRLLSRIGSEKFKELTGHYSFDEEGQFQIVDQRTGLTRSPETLSGGETFLASLSLALALSEAVALEGGRLGCFFLDEGFGSLDQESLDLALEGIETLADPGRLIGLISHIPGVQARLEDLIILERSGDGSTEVVQHEGPIGYASLLI